jgi:hypothetical protein
MSKQATAWAILSLLIAGDLFPGSAAGADCRPKAASANTEVTLTHTHTKARVQLPAEFAANPTQFLQVPITHIANTAETAFSIFVYLEWPGAKDDSTPREVPLGNFTVYPADQPGTYVLRVSDGFRQLRALGVNPGQDQVVVLLEMKRVSEKTPWTSIEVSIAPLRWLEDPR